MYISISQERINLSYNTRNIKKRKLLTKWIPKNIFLNFWISLLNYSLYSLRLAPMWQQSGTLLFCSCHGIAGFLVDELQI